MFPRLRFYWVVAVCGAVLMALEILSSRVLAPHYGNSVYVWGSIISVFLAALSLGYLLGGRLADRQPSMAALGRMVALAAACEASPALRAPARRRARRLHRREPGGDPARHRRAVRAGERAARHRLPLGGAAGGPRPRASGQHRRAPVRPLHPGEPRRDARLHLPPHPVPGAAADPRAARGGDRAHRLRGPRGLLPRRGPGGGAGRPCSSSFRFRPRRSPPAAPRT